MDVVLVRSGAKSIQVKLSMLKKLQGDTAPASLGLGALLGEEFSAGNETDGPKVGVLVEWKIVVVLHVVCA